MKTASGMAAVLAALLLVPTAAVGSPVVDQYVEEVPGVGGNKPPSPSDPSSGSAGGGRGAASEGEGARLPNPVRRGLAAAGGADGRAEAALRRSDVDGGSWRARADGADPGAKASLENATSSLDGVDDEAGPAESLGAALGLGGGLGGVLVPALLLGSLIAAAVLSRRRSHPDEAQSPRG